MFIVTDIFYVYPYATSVKIYHILYLLFKLGYIVTTEFHRILFNVHLKYIILQKLKYHTRRLRLCGIYVISEISFRIKKIV